MSGRRILVSGREWRYRIGNFFCVAKAMDNGEGQRINLSDLTGWTWPDIERSKWKGGEWCVRPSHVAKWLMAFPYLPVAVRSGERPTRRVPKLTRRQRSHV